MFLILFFSSAIPETLSLVTFQNYLGILLALPDNPIINGHLRVNPWWIIREDPFLLSDSISHYFFIQPTGLCFLNTLCTLPPPAFAHSMAVARNTIPSHPDNAQPSTASLTRALSGTLTCHGCHLTSLCTSLPLTGRSGPRTHGHGLPSHTTEPTWEADRVGMAVLVPQHFTQILMQ